MPTFSHNNAAVRCCEEKGLLLFLQRQRRGTLCRIKAEKRRLSLGHHHAPPPPHPSVGPFCFSLSPPPSSKDGSSFVCSSSTVCSKIWGKSMTCWKVVVTLSTKAEIDRRKFFFQRTAFFLPFFENTVQN